MHIDPWTIGLQAVNFLVLVWLLRHFLYAPVTAMLQARHAETARLFDAVEAKQAEAEALRGTLDARVRAIETERAALLDAARAQAEAEAARKREAAQVEADAIAATMRQTLADERSATEGEIRNAARTLALAIARRLLDGILPSVPLAAFIEAVTTEIGHLPLDSGTKLLQPGETVEMSSSEPLEPALVDQLAAHLGQILNQPVTLTCSVKSDLIAGVEVAFPRLVVRRCWADDLTQILKELDHADGALSVPRAMAG